MASNQIQELYPSTNTYQLNVVNFAVLELCDGIHGIRLDWEGHTVHMRLPSGGTNRSVILKQQQWAHTRTGTRQQHSLLHRQTPESTLAHTVAQTDTGEHTCSHCCTDRHRRATLAHTVAQTGTGEQHLLILLYRQAQESNTCSHCCTDRHRRATLAHTVVQTDRGQ